MGVFECLGVILSVIMGLGVTHILAGLSKTIHHRNSVKPYWVQALWALNVLIYIVTIWWGMFWWSSQQEWSYFQFLLLILYAIFLFLSASLIFPWDVPMNSISRIILTKPVPGSSRSSLWLGASIFLKRWPSLTLAFASYRMHSLRSLSRISFLASSQPSGLTRTITSFSQYFGPCTHWAICQLRRWQRLPPDKFPSSPQNGWRRRTAACGRVLSVTSARNGRLLYFA